MGAASTAKGLVRSLVDVVTLRSKVHEYGGTIREQQKQIANLTERTIHLEALREKLAALDGVIKDQQKSIERLTARSIRAEFLEDLVQRYEHALRSQQSKIEDLAERVVRSEVRSEMQGVSFPLQFPERRLSTRQGHGQTYLPASADEATDDEEEALGRAR